MSENLKKSGPLMEPENVGKLGHALGNGFSHTKDINNTKIES